MSFDRTLFLPVNREDMARRGWDGYDFLLDRKSTRLNSSHMA